MKIAQKLTLAALLWLIIVNPGSINNTDTQRRLKMSHAWWTGTEEMIPGDKLTININDKNYIPYDLGQSMMMLPGDWLGHKLGQNFSSTQERQSLAELIISFLIFLPLNLLAITSSFRLLKLLGYPEKIAALASLVLLLGTSFLFYSSFHQQNNQIILLVLLGYETVLSFVVKKQKKFLIFSGLALGLAFLIRVTSVFHVATVLLFLVGLIINQQIQVSKSKDQKTALLSPILAKSINSTIWWLLGFIPFVILERALTFYRYGNWFVTATSLHVKTFTTPSTNNVSNTVNNVVQGENQSIPWQDILEKIQIDKLFAPLLSPEKSIFLYDPLVPICLILVIVCWRYLSNPIKLFLGVGLINFIFHWALFSWVSSWVLHGEWGARYHVTSIHLLLLPLIPLIIQGATKKVNKDSLSKIFSGIARIILVVAILIQLASVVLPPGLEAAQQKIGIGSSLRLVQRIQNIGLVASYDHHAHPQISKVLAESPGFAPNNRVVWDLFPFRFQDRISKDSSLAFLAPILIILWLVLLIMAIASTVWLFVS